MLWGRERSRPSQSSSHTCSHEYLWSQLSLDKSQLGGSYSSNLIMVVSPCPLLKTSHSWSHGFPGVHPHWRPLLTCPPGHLQSLAPGTSLWIGTPRGGQLCQLPGNHRHALPSSPGTSSARAVISDDSGDFTTAVEGDRPVSAGGHSLAHAY